MTKKNSSHEHSRISLASNDSVSRCLDNTYIQLVHACAHQTCRLPAPRVGGCGARGWRLIVKCSRALTRPCGSGSFFKKQQRAPFSPSLYISPSPSLARSLIARAFIASTTQIGSSFHIRARAACAPAPSSLPASVHINRKSTSPWLSGRNASLSMKGPYMRAFSLCVCARVTKRREVALAFVTLPAAYRFRCMRVWACDDFERATSARARFDGKFDGDCGPPIVFFFFSYFVARFFSYRWAAGRVETIDVSFNLIVEVGVGVVLNCRLLSFSKHLSKNFGTFQEKR